jgi:polysaccharide biosynthesis/export protein
VFSQRTYDVRLMRFATKLAALAIAAVVAAAPGTARADTLLAKGDVLDIQVFPEANLSQQVTVASDGSIGIALLGRVPVAGLTTTQTEAEISKGLLKYLKHPIVTVALHTQANYDVLVLGNVKTPGRYMIPPGAKVSDAIAAAGGLNPIMGAFPDARVTDGSNKVHDVSLEALFRRGDVTQNVALSSGAAVYVPGPQIFRVRVLGAVDHPGDVELNDGDRLAAAIAKAGNSPNTNADLNHIRVTHTTPDGKVHVTETDLYKMLKEGDLASDIALANNDVVYVPESRKKTQGGAGILSVLRQIFLPF